MKRLLPILFLLSPVAAQADYAADKSTCTTASNNVALFASLRDENVPRESLIDKTLTLADENRWPAEAALMLIYQIQFAYALPDVSPEAMKKQVYTECMKRRGHTQT